MLEKATVSLQNHQGKIKGTGVLVSDRYVITCAHVVNAVLGRDPYSQEQPDATHKLDLCFRHLSKEPEVKATVIAWRPIETDDGGDLAILALCENTPKPALAIAAKLALADAFKDLNFETSGFAYTTGTLAKGLVQGEPRYGFLQLEYQKGINIKEGYSGAGVWCDQVGGVVGIITLRNIPQKDLSYGISTRLFVELFPELKKLILPQEQVSIKQLSPAGGALEALSPFYIDRASDQAALALCKQGKALTVHIRGARQMGKTSLLYKMLKHLQADDVKVIRLDFQRDFDQDDFEDMGHFFKLFCYLVDEELGLGSF
ncbi:MAG: AAA-like domain-containing protein, partial [Deinococcales bacterium]